jgi:flavin reductase (DIM6/NTAB) family NADH-FMN oxidoreductase RutF
MDSGTRKKTLRLLSNGVYIITSRAGNRFGAATVTWVSQASFKPPLVMAAIRPESNVFRCLQESGTAVIHIVDSSQQAMAQQFFCPTRVDDRTINGQTFHASTTSAPVLDSAGAYIECAVRRIIRETGDHAIVIMEVVDATYRFPVQPMTIRESPWEYGG